MSETRALPIVWTSLRSVSAWTWDCPECGQLNIASTERQPVEGVAVTCEICGLIATLSTSVDDE